MPNSDWWAPRLLAVLRVMTALLFLEHASMKFLDFPAPIPGLSHPLPLIILVAGAIELVTSALIIAGLWTRPAALIASGEMAAAYWLAHAPRGFWPALNMGEPAILFCFTLLYIAAAGPGMWAIADLLKPSTRPQARKV